MDIKHLVFDKDTTVSIGTEYMTYNRIYLRGGLSQKKFLSGNTDNLDLSCGFGLKFGNNQVDYAFTPFGQLGNTHRISLSFKF